jgi:hypothetical protein
MLSVETTTAAADVQAIVGKHRGNRIFEAALENLSVNHLVRAVSRYIHFNSIFGSGVANLAGEIGARPDLFRDPNEQIEELSDRSVSVAAAVFSAAIDEFGDSALPNRGNHRTLAQATLKGILGYFGFDADAVRTLLSAVGDSVARSLARVRHGYGLNQSLDERRLFAGIGFHIASELLADEEFRILDASLRVRYPRLVAHLESSMVAINGQRCPGYHWIKVHTTVEAEHCANAWRAAELACKYYAGARPVLEVQAWIVDGFAEFAAVQTEFMQGF